MNYIIEYKNQIDNGAIIAGKWIKKVLEMIADGLKDGRFMYDNDRADRAINWIEAHCFHTEGHLAPNNIVLELWQKAIISAMFGIVDIKSGKRQFREVVLIVSRKNGKSLFASAIAKYIFYEDGGYGARVYCIAPKLEQADIIYSNIWQMITIDPEWQALKLAIEGSAEGHNKRTMDSDALAKHRQSDLFLPATNCTVKKIAFSAKKSDGFNPSLVICDEIASWEGAQGLKQYEVMKSGMGAREMGDSPAILLSCSTSGYINDSIYDELIKRATRMLLGESKEQRLLPFLYMIDDLDKWNDLDELKKSNPNMDVSVSSDYLKEEIAIAEGSLSKKAEFFTKYCNIKQNSSLAWLSSQDVMKACGEHLYLEDYRGCYAVGGIDLSQTTDLTACTLVIEKDGILNIFAHFFLPHEKIQEASDRDGLPYQLYIERGLMTASGENFIDYHDCYKWFTDLIEKYEIYPLVVGYDRYSAQYLIQDLNTYGFMTDDVYQGDNLYPVLMEFEGLLKDGKVNIGDNDLLKVHLLNSAIKMNQERGRGKLVKLNVSDHIDGTAAVMDAMTVRQKWFAQYGEQLRN